MATPGAGRAGVPLAAEQKHLQGEGQHTQGQGPLVAVLVGRDSPFFQIALAQALQFGKEAVTRQSIHPQAEGAAPAHPRQLFQAGQVEPGHDQVSLVVLHESVGAPLRVGHGNEPPAFLTHSHRDDLDPLLATEMGLLLPVPFQVLAIGDQQNGLEGPRSPSPRPLASNPRLVSRAAAMAVPCSESMSGPAMRRKISAVP
jgi:hypothetical protein